MAEALKHTGLLYKNVFVYLDDILIASRDEESHLRHLEAVLQVLRKFRLYAKLSKCEFGKRKLKCLGHIIGAGFVQADPKTLRRFRRGLFCDH